MPAEGANNAERKQLSLSVCATDTHVSGLNGREAFGRIPSGPRRRRKKGKKQAPLIDTKENNAFFAARAPTTTEGSSFKADYDLLLIGASSFCVRRRSERVTQREVGIGCSRKKVRRRR